MCCFAGQNAPRDPFLTMEVLYQLSYVGTTPNPNDPAAQHRPAAFQARPRPELFY